MNKPVKAFLWDFLDLFAGRGVIFIISIFLARLLTPEDFGLVAMIMCFAGIYQGIVDMEFSTTFVQVNKFT